MTGEFFRLQRSHPPGRRSSAARPKAYWYPYAGGPAPLPTTVTIAWSWTARGGRRARPGSGEGVPRQRTCPGRETLKKLLKNQRWDTRSDTWSRAAWTRTKWCRADLFLLGSEKADAVRRGLEFILVSTRPTRDFAGISRRCGRRSCSARMMHGRDGPGHRSEVYKEQSTAPWRPYTRRKTFPRNRCGPARSGGLILGGQRRDAAVRSLTSWDA